MYEIRNGKRHYNVIDPDGDYKQIPEPAVALLSVVKLLPEFDRHNPGGMPHSVTHLAMRSRIILGMRTYKTIDAGFKEKQSIGYSIMKNHLNGRTGVVTNTLDKLFEGASLDDIRLLDDPSQVIVMADVSPSFYNLLNDFRRQHKRRYFILL